MTGTRRRIVFAGTPDFAVPSLAALLESAHDVVGVLTQPDRPAGRGRAPRPSPVKELALEHGLEVLQPQSLKQESDQAALRALQPELMVVVAYGLLLPQAVLDLPARGCINVHASLLPRWRGAAPIQAALLAGDTETGVCLMQLEAGLDTGPVLARDRLAIGPRENASELHDRLAARGAALLSTHIDAILDGRLEAEPQADAGITYAGRIKKADARIDWQDSAVAIDRQVRAWFGWPVAETTLGGKQLRIWAAETAGPGEPGTLPGSILAEDADGVLVQTGDGVLRLLSVQAAGKSRVSAAEFARGRPLAGQRLGT